MARYHGGGTDTEEESAKLANSGKEQSSASPCRVSKLRPSDHGCCAVPTELSRPPQKSSCTATEIVTNTQSTVLCHSGSSPKERGHARKATAKLDSVKKGNCRNGQCQERRLQKWTLSRKATAEMDIVKKGDCRNGRKKGNCRTGHTREVIAEEDT